MTLDEAENILSEASAFLGDLVIDAAGKASITVNGMLTLREAEALAVFLKDAEEYERKQRNG